MSQAYVELRSGRSRTSGWTFSSTETSEPIRVGTSAMCAWRVAAPGVLPQHLELAWIEDSLWVNPVNPRHPVRVDGAQVDAWSPVDVGAEIAFGDAALVVLARPRTPIETVLSAVGFQVAAPDEPTVMVRGGPERTALTDLASLQQWAQRCASDPPAPSPPPLTTVQRLDAPAPQPLDPRFAAPPAQVDGAAPEPAPTAAELLERARELAERVADRIPARLVLGAFVVAIVAVLMLVHGYVNARGTAPARRDAPAPAPASATSPAAAPAPAPQPAPPLDPVERERAEATAARLVAAGRLAEALPIYDRLAAGAPDNDAYRIAARVLRQRGGDACAGGEPCAP